MELLTTIKKDQLQARKDKDKIKASLLTTIMGEVETLQKKQEKVDVTAVLKKFEKGLQETLKVLCPEQQNSFSVRTDEGSKVVEAAYELSIVQSYLPKQLTEEDLKNIIRGQVVDGVLNMGQIMGYLKKEYPNQYDGKLASQIAKSIIAAADSFL